MESHPAEITRFFFGQAPRTREKNLAFRPIALDVAGSRGVSKSAGVCKGGKCASIRHGNHFQLKV
ncbi:MAG: hypothetical protein ACRECP_07030, partial [Methylocella sp.]